MLRITLLYPIPSGFASKACDSSPQPREVNHNRRDFIDGRSEKNQLLLSKASPAALPCIDPLYPIIEVGQSCKTTIIPVKFGDQFQQSPPSSSSFCTINPPRARGSLLFGFLDLLTAQISRGMSAPALSADSHLTLGIKLKWRQLSLPSSALFSAGVACVSN